MSSFGQYLSARKPPFIALVVGLLLGPLISGMAGWQVTATTLHKTVKDAVMEQQVKFCEVRARAAAGDTTNLSYNDRFKLAEKWGQMPWQKQVNQQVVDDCSNGLSESP